MENQLTAQQQQQQLVIQHQFEMSPMGQMLKQFEITQRMGKMYAESTIVPDTYKKNVANCAIAINMAVRMGADPMMVMQNLYMVHGNPSFSSKFLISCINSCGRFSPLQYEMEYDEQGNPVSCFAYAYPADYKITGDGRTDNPHRLVGDKITMQMVQSEGWSSKAGSKWKTMPGQMFRYRAAAFWQRVFAPEISMGFVTEEEARETEWADYEEIKDERKTRKQKSAEQLAMMAEEEDDAPAANTPSEEAAPEPIAMPAAEPENGAPASFFEGQE